MSDGLFYTWMIVGSLLLVALIVYYVKMKKAGKL
jgi:hypothetical protein